MTAILCNKIANSIWHIRDFESKITSIQNISFVDYQPTPIKGVNMAAKKKAAAKKKPAAKKKVAAKKKK